MSRHITKKISHTRTAQPLRLQKSNGREGYERIYEYNGGHILLAGIGLNGFMVSAYPLKDGKA